MEPLMTIDEAAKLTRLSIKTLYSYAEKQIVPHVKLGKRLFFSEKKLESWVNECSIEPVEKEFVE